MPEVELSIRCQTTVAGSDASALCVTKMRPAQVAAQSVPWSALSRAIHEIEPPVRSAPYTVPVRSPGAFVHDGSASRRVADGPPSGRKSPQSGSAAEATNSGQFAS